MGLGMVDEELSTATKENKPHFGAGCVEDKLNDSLSISADSLSISAVQITILKPMNRHLATCCKFLLPYSPRLSLNLWLLN